MTEISVNNSPLKLRIGISTLLSPDFLLPFIMQVKQRHPSLLFDMISEQSSVLVDLVSLGQLDVCLVPFYASWPGCQSIPIFTEEMVIVRHSKHRSDTFILYNQSFRFCKLMVEVAETMSVTKRGNIQEVNNLPFIYDMIGNDMGYTILPSSYIIAAEAQSLIPSACIIEPIRKKTLYRPIHFLYSPKFKHDLPFMQLAEELQTYCRSRFMRHPANPADQHQHSS